jgi:integrase/recombinase XerD
MQVKKTVGFMKMEFETWVDGFIGDMDATPETVKNNRSIMGIFTTWCVVNGFHHNQITRPVVIQFKNHLVDTGLTPLTVDSYLSTVKRFYKWTESNGVFPDVAAGIKSKTNHGGFRKKPLDHQQLHDLMDAVDFTAKTGHRDAIIMEMMVWMGLRCIEIRRLDVADVVVIPSGFGLWVLGKGCREKELMKLPDDIHAMIQQYLATRITTPDHPLFAATSNHNRGGRITTRRISMMVKTYMRAAGINSPEFTAHSLRHTCGVMMIQSGRDIDAVRTYLRHTNTNMTVHYIHYNDNNRRLNDNWADEKRREMNNSKDMNHKKQ